MPPGRRWEPWTPLAVRLSTHLLFAGFPAELWREQVIRHPGPDAVGLFATDGPGTAGGNGWLVSGARTTKAFARFVRQGFVPGQAVVLPEVDLPDVHLPEKHARLAFLDVAFGG
ncbi:hypothetical protein Shyhy01_26840 [Streptomyces hygroscopicus subsp. hygroscopicus]|nr:hypothetical protein Shyhy01_26840 [Streptomyces hygroscopicus subsp. hygroscopicus]